MRGVIPEWKNVESPITATIFISDFYTGAPLAFAFYTSFDPEKFREAINNPITVSDERHVIRLGKYHFGSLDLNEKRLKEGFIPSKTLYIGRPEEVDGQETIVAPDDGRVSVRRTYRSPFATPCWRQGAIGVQYGQHAPLRT